MSWVVLVFVGWSAALCWHDMRSRRLPNVLTLPGSVVAVGYGAAIGQFGPALLGAVALSGLYLIPYLFRPSVVGGGDIKLAFAVGALAGMAGVHTWFVVAIAAPALAVVVALAAIVATAIRRTMHPIASIAYGPCLCGAALLALV